MSTDPALLTYISESKELLEEMEAALLFLEESPSEEEAVEQMNALFRAAHTIKGSAGLFSLDTIVAFTHEAETLLDLLREDQIQLTVELSSLLFMCKDMLQILILNLENGQETLSEEDDSHYHTILTELKKHTKSPDDSVIDTQENNSANPHGSIIPSEISSVDNVETSLWLISLRFNIDSLRNGMDPLSFIRYLERLGEIVNIVTHTEDIPAWQNYDVESCYIGCEISLKSNADKEAIEDVFEFIREDSQVKIIPPKSLISDYIQLIHSLPEDNSRLGEILIQCGVLTEYELAKSLDEQAEELVERPLGEILIANERAPKTTVEAALSKQDQNRKSPAAENQFLKIEANKLDDLINLIGELVTAGAATSLSARNSGNKAAIESASIMSVLLDQVRDATLQLRMVQIGGTFNRFRRVVRDVSKELAKQIDINITGADTELDKTIVEKIADPLMHLVRNSMDHGIEAPTERLAAGKSERGLLSLNAYHDSGSVVIEVSDDGKGLDPDKILQKAIEKGLVSDNNLLDKREIFNLIFEPGFSTAAAVTNLSGRGVGMDVVRRNINDLGGRIEINSELGLGTMIRLNLPLTLAIIDGFQVEVGNSTFVIPLDAVRECVELRHEHIGEDQNRHYMNLRNEVLPFIRLRNLYDIHDEKPRRENVVIVQSGQQKVGLVVDRLTGELQTVIKSLGQIFSHLRGVGGSTIMGNGDVALVLDIPAMLQLVTENELAKTA